MPHMIALNTGLMAQKMAVLEYSYTRLAERAGCHISSVSRAMTDGAATPVITGKIARALGLSVAEITAEEAGK